MTNDIPVINLLPQKYQGVAMILVLISPYISRAFYAIMNGGGIKGMLSAIWIGTNVPKDKQ